MWRLIKLWISDVERSDLLEQLEDVEYLDGHIETGPDDVCAAAFVVETEKTEAFVDRIDAAYSRRDTFRIVTLDVEATVPQPDLVEDAEDGEPDAETDGNDGESNRDAEGSPPIHLEELYNDITTGLKVDGTFVAMALLSSVVAAIGIVRNDVAIVIAAMIIAPLLQPNMALSMATTLADRDLAVRSLGVNAVGLGLSVAVAVAFGFFYSLDPTLGQIALRTKLGYLEIGLAASAGAAGAVSYTSGEAGRVVGVMVAVALLPPVVVFGMLLGSTRWQLALGAFFLTAANIVCLNLSGVVTFLLRHVRPRNAFESDRADRATRRAIAIWLVLLAILVAVIYVGGDFRRYP